MYLILQWRFKMYACVKDDEIIAFHDEYEVVERFTTSFSPNDDIKIIKIKKKKEKHIRKNPSYDELYLVRYGDNYIPMNLFLISQEEDCEKNYDLKYCKDVLYRILETKQITSLKDFNAISRVIKIITHLMEPSIYDVNTLNELKMLKEMYRNSVDNEE